MSLKKLSALFVVAGSAALSACGGGGSAGSGQMPPQAQSVVLQGVAAKGLLLDAIVTVYPVANGAPGTTSLAATRTDATTGAFAVPVAASGPVVVVVTTDASTRMLDELSGSAVAAPPGLTLHAALDGLANPQMIAVTPLTELGFVIAAATNGGLNAASIDTANTAVSNALLAGAPVIYTRPIDLRHYATATVAQQEQAKFLTALAVAASRGTATGVGGSACSGTYAANIVCLVGGVGNLLSLNSSGAAVLGSGAAYVAAAYRSLTAGAVTIEGGHVPAAFGLNVPTAAETGFLAAVGTQAPFPGGYTPDPGLATADLVANTRAFFADIRTNIVDQHTTQTFGYAPTLTALQNDVKNNAGPVIANTASIAAAAYKSAELIQNGTTSTGGYGPALEFVNTPIDLLYTFPAHASSGIFYVANGNATIAQVIAASSTLYAGQPGVTGSADGAALKATFTGIDGMAADTAGNLYVTDGYTTIREISTAGVVTTLAGTQGVYGSNGGAAGSALFGGIVGIVVDAAGNIYVADYGNSVIWKLSSGQVSVYAGQVGVPGAIGGAALTQATFGCPSALAIDASSNIYVTDDCNTNIRVISAGGMVSTLAGQAGVPPGYLDGPGNAALFGGPIDSLTLAGNGDLYVYDTNNKAVRQITVPAGVVSTVVSAPASSGPATGSTLGYLSGLTAVGSTLYAADYRYDDIQQISTAGTVSPVAHGAAKYSGHCGYDPVGLGTATNVALCRYGSGTSEILLTVTQTGATTYTLETQALQSDIDQNPASPTYGQCLLPQPYNAVTFCFTPVPGIAPLQANFTWTTSASGAQSATLGGPYYVNSSGGQVQGTLALAESANWDPTTDTGSLSLSGTISGGSGGVSLVNATIGSDSVITLQDFARLFAPHGTGIEGTAVAGDPAITATGVLDLTNITTDAFIYAARFTIGAPVYDKSQELSLPATISLAGSINQVTAGGSSPLFNGTIGLDVVGLPNFDATQPLSATNSFTVGAQIAGTVDFTGGRVLSVTASASGSQNPATPAQPDSISVTYSYATAAGTTVLNATGQYDATNGFSGTLNDNAGVIVTVVEPVGGPVSATVTDNGVETATVAKATTGLTINYIDGTTESLY